MKCFLLTMLAFCCAVAAYSQTGHPQRRSAAQTKSDAAGVTATAAAATSSPAGGSKATATGNAPANVAGVTVTSPMPALFLWKLPLSLPNPFIKEDD